MKINVRACSCIEREQNTSENASHNTNKARKRAFTITKHKTTTREREQKS